jgi:single-strand DNA-binding protein
MSSFNKVILMGNLTRDPETRVTPNGVTICKIGLAVNRTYTTSDGEKKDEVTFVDCDAIGKTGEAISRWMSKGKGILIEGRLRFDQWEDKTTGQLRSKLGVVIEHFNFIGGRSEDGSESSESPARQDPVNHANKPASRNTTPRTQSRQNSIDDDVPF